MTSNEIRAAAGLILLTVSVAASAAQPLKNKLEPLSTDIRNGNKNSSSAATVANQKRLNQIVHSPGVAGQTENLLPAGLTYVWWKFGVAEFEDFQIDITIHNDLGTKPGTYFQMYQGQIGGLGFYLGLQTDVYQPNRGGQGKGLIFSRWKTRDLADVRPASDGWTQSAGYEGDFVGIRKKYEWTNHKYRLRLTALDEDEKGVWYGFFILDNTTQTEDYCGSIRFPKEQGRRPKIKDGGGTWTEIYSGARDLSQLPAWHVSIDGCFVEHRRRKAQSAVSDYSKVPNTDIYFEPAKQSIQILMGPDVQRK